MATSTIKQVTNTSGSGYCKMPDGTLIQWGYNIIDANKDVVDITFEIAFADALYGFTTMSVFANDRTMTYVYGSATATGIRVYSRVNPVTLEQRFKWIAVGRWK